MNKALSALLVGVAFLVGAAATLEGMVEAPGRSLTPSEVGTMRGGQVNYCYDVPAYCKAIRTCAQKNNTNLATCEAWFNEEKALGVPDKDCVNFVLTKNCGAQSYVPANDPANNIENGRMVCLWFNSCLWDDQNGTCYVSNFRFVGGRAPKACIDTCQDPEPPN